MSLRKIVVYTKLVGITLVVLAVVIFMASNREPVEVQFLGWTIVKTPLFAFILAAAGLGIAIFQIVRKIRGVFKEVGQLQKDEDKQKEPEKTEEEVKKEL